MSVAILAQESANSDPSFTFGLHVYESPTYRGPCFPLRSRFLLHLAVHFHSHSVVHPFVISAPQQVGAIERIRSAGSRDCWQRSFAMALPDTAAGVGAAAFDPSSDDIAKIGTVDDAFAWLGTSEPTRAAFAAATAVGLMCELGQGLGWAWASLLAVCAGGMWAER